MDRHFDLKLIISAATILAAICLSYGALSQKIVGIDSRLVRIENRIDRGTIIISAR